MLNWLVAASKLHKHRETCCTAEWPFYSFLILWYRVAVKVHNDIKSAPSHNCIGNINEKSAEEVVTESLFMLIAMLCAGDNDNEEGANVEIKMQVLSICQDIIFLASRGRKLTPKHVGLGLAWA